MKRNYEISGPSRPPPDLPNQPSYVHKFGRLVRAPNNSHQELISCAWAIIRGGVSDTLATYEG